MISVLASVLLTISCSVSGEPLPTEELIDNSNAPEVPTDYQLLYDSPGLPKPSLEMQRVRSLIWLKRMNLSQSQIKRMMDLRQEVNQRERQIIDSERQAANQVRQIENPIYDQIWANLTAGQDLSSDDMAEPLTKLNTSRENNKRGPFLQVRTEAIRGIFDSQRTFLKELSRNQEQTMVEALFFLRHLLDPIGNPRDFQVLVGNTYEPGQYAVLGRGNSEIARQSMNIGGLWTDKDEKTGRALHEARLEAILYLLLLEPGLDEALEAALSLTQN